MASHYFSLGWGGGGVGGQKWKLYLLSPTNGVEVGLSWADLGNIKAILNYDTATKTTNKLIGFDPILFVHSCPSTADFNCFVLHEPVTNAVK